MLGFIGLLVSWFLGQIINFLKVNVLLSRNHKHVNIRMHVTHDTHTTRMEPWGSQCASGAKSGAKIETTTIEKKRTDLDFDLHVARDRALIVPALRNCAQELDDAISELEGDRVGAMDAFDAYTETLRNALLGTLDDWIARHRSKMTSVMDRHRMSLETLAVRMDECLQHCTKEEILGEKKDEDEDERERRVEGVVASTVASAVLMTMPGSRAQIRFSARINISQIQALFDGFVDELPKRPFRYTSAFDHYAWDGRSVQMWLRKDISCDTMRLLHSTTRVFVSVVSKIAWKRAQREKHRDEMQHFYKTELSFTVHHMNDFHVLVCEPVLKRAPDDTCADIFLFCVGEFKMIFDSTNALVTPITESIVTPETPKTLASCGACSSVCTKV